MHFLGGLATLVAILASLADCQRPTTTRTTSVRPTTRATSLTASNTIYRCGCVFPTNSLTAAPLNGVTTITTTLAPSSTFACGCTSSRLVSTSRSSSVRTSTIRTSTVRTSTVRTSTVRTSTSALRTSTVRASTSTVRTSTVSASTGRTSTPVRASTTLTSSTRAGTTSSQTSSSAAPASSTSTVILVVEPTSTRSTPSLATNSTTQSSASLSTSSSVQSQSTGSSTSSSPVTFPSLDPTTNSTTNGTFGGQSVRNTILVLARNANDAYNAYSGLQGYGIPYEVLLVPQSGVTLPDLNSSTTQGNYGGFITVSELSYQTSTGGWASGLTDAQFTAIYNYQKAFGVRMVRLDTYPWSAFGAVALGTSGGCCDYGVEQLISFTNTSGFPTANLKEGAGMSTKSIWHYPAAITDPKTTWEIASYDASSNGNYPNKTTAAVINDFAGRQQMVFFSGWATEWSATSNFLQHAYIHWMTRGLFVGSRKIYLGAQIDDVQLRTQTYSPAGNFYRSVPRDYQMHAEWQVGLNSRLPAGSNFFLELGHNGNGNIIAATNNTANGSSLCTPNTAIYYRNNDFSTLEFQKPLGSGESVWPTTPTNYTWSIACASIDNLARWFMVPTNLNNFAHVSHTFTHLHQNNATYSDIDKEIFFNQEWMNAIGIARANRFSPKGLIPPAITGLHNGDAIRAWSDNGLTAVVGDNSRPVLRNSVNPFWPYITNLPSNGFDGMVVMPRWPTKIYYDCDLPDCTTQEWTDLFRGTGSFADLLASEKSITTRYLMSLRQDPYMFHQANLRANDVATTTVGSQTGQFSLVQIWIETVTQEMQRLTNWPIVTLKHDDLAVKFNERMARDNCQPNLVYQYSEDGNSIVGVTVSANGNTCSAPIGVTFPGQAFNAAATDDKLGSEPLIKWVRLSGNTQSYTLGRPIPIRS